MKKVQGLLLLLTGIAIGSVGMLYYDKKVFNQMRERDQEYYDAWINFYKEELAKYGWEEDTPSAPEYTGEEATDGEMSDQQIKDSIEVVTGSMDIKEWQDKYSGNVNNQIDYSAMAQKKPLSQILKEKGLNPLPDEKSLTRVHDFPEEDEPEAEEEDFEEQPIKDIPKTRGITIITGEEFSDESENEDYERISLTYYNTDGVLVDERDEPVPSPENVLGQEALANFGKDSMDPDMVYVRNDLTSTLFEVARVYQSFAQVVLGITEPIVQPKHESIQKTKARKVKKVLSDGEI